jgi:hypothetical protein
MAGWSAALFFLPLFPASAVLNRLALWLPSPLLRASFLLLWPQVGVYLLAKAGPVLPAWIMPWALATAVVYALRLLTVREMNRWATLYATSALALLWMVVGRLSPTQLVLAAFWFAAPAAVLVLVASAIASRVGAAYAGLGQSLAANTPRLALLTALAVLVAMAAPPAPGFFVLLSLAQKLPLVAQLMVLLVWLLWSAAGIRLVMGFLGGRDTVAGMRDLRPSVFAAALVALLLFLIGGLVWPGGVS